MSTHVLDHIVHLTPPGTVDLASAAFRTLGFDVIPGGTHAGGVTYNALVILADGVYLELIAFVDPSSPPPASHRWGTAAPGWIDFAHLGLTPDVASVVNARAAKDGSGAKYLKGVDEGRETPQGKRLQWRVTSPAAGHGVGRLPFFCEDVTPRGWRVPEPGAHPNGAQGVSHVKLLAKDRDEFAALAAQLTTVLGVSPSLTASGIATWPLQTPAPRPGLHTQLTLEQDNGAGKSGIYEVGFWVAQGREGEADSPYGRVVWTPVPGA